MKGYNYLEFPPGNNIWRKPVRFLALNFERIGILMGYFLITILLLNIAFSYEWTLSKTLFCLTVFVLAIYSVLPAPSNPNSLVIVEVFLRTPKTIKEPSYRATMKVLPLDRED